MKDLNDLIEIYNKAIDATIYSHGNFDAYTQKQQEQLLELKASIEHFEEIAVERDLDNDYFVEKVNGWILSTATKFAKDIYYLQSNYELEDMDKEYYDGRWDKGNTTYYEILIPTEEYAVFEFAGLTEYADWNQRI